MGKSISFDLKNKCRQNKRFFNALNIPLCTLYASSLGCCKTFCGDGFSVSRFLGFSVRNLVSRRCRRFGWRSKASGRMCAASARSFWIVVLWKSGIPDVENGETINNGVMSPVNMESLLIQSTIRVGFGEILVLTMVYTTGGSWKSIGWQLGRSLVAPRRARGDLLCDSPRMVR